MVVLNESKINEIWYVKEALKSEELTEIEITKNKALPSIGRITSFGHDNDYSCRLTWTYQIVTKKGKEILFDYMLIDTNSMLGYREEEDKQDLIDLIRQSNNDFISVFKAKSKYTLVENLPLSELPNEKIKDLYNDILAVIKKLNKPKN